MVVALDLSDKKGDTFLGMPSIATRLFDEAGDLNLKIFQAPPTAQQINKPCQKLHPQDCFFARYFCFIRSHLPFPITVRKMKRK